jgi:succinate dehydrogenase hydrophobic anchor subunit
MKRSIHPPSLWRWFALLGASYLSWVLLGPQLALLWTLAALLLAWLHHQQGRWARIARQGTWNVERDQARQRLRLGTFLAALLCLALGVVTLFSLF